MYISILTNYIKHNELYQPYFYINCINSVGFCITRSRAEERSGRRAERCRGSNCNWENLRFLWYVLSGSFEMVEISEINGIFWIFSIFGILVIVLIVFKTVKMLNHVESFIS